MFQLKLGQDMPACPQPWQNMIKYLQSEPDTNVSDEDIAVELNKFNARLIYNNGYVVLFDTNSDHLLWCLRWA